MANEVIITADKFQTYETLCQTGIIDMRDTAVNVERCFQFSGLTRAESIEIIKHYSEYKKKFSSDN